jgi:hypothetical protein
MSCHNCLCSVASPPLLTVALLLSVCENSFAAATSEPNELVKGVTDIVSGGLPGPVHPMSDTWWPVVAASDSSSFPSLFAAARLYGNGRVVIVGHDGIMSTVALDNDVFRLNIMQWLNVSHLDTVRFTTGHGEWVNASTLAHLENQLDAVGMSLGPLAAPINSDALLDVSVLIVGNAWGDFADDEISAVESLVADGGGLLLVGLGWSWLAYHPGSIMDDYPMMQIASPYEVRWLNGGIIDPDNQHNGSTVFTKFYPDISEVTIQDAFEAIVGTHVKYTNTLPKILESDAALRLAFTRAHQTLAIPATEFPGDHFERAEVFSMYTEFVKDWPSFYARNFVFDQDQHPSATWLHMDFYTVTPSPGGGS